MEKWAGTKLKATSCYGVRSYYRGSVLANHVDRVDTHVISAIINVAQARDVMYTADEVLPALLLRCRVLEYVLVCQTNCTRRQSTTSRGDRCQHITGNDT